MTGRAVQMSQRATERICTWDQQYYELTLQPRLFQFTPASKDRPPRLADRRGAGRDRFGNWYWIDKTEREILVNSVGTQVTSHFWSVGDGLECERAAGIGHFAPKTPRQEPIPLQCRGLAVAEDHYLVVGVLQPAGLLIFDLHSGGPPRQMLWPEAVEFTPFDMAPRPGGGVWILDRDFTRPFKPVRYWALDRHFNVIGRDQQETTLAEEQADDFQPKDRSAIRRTAKETFPRGITLDISSPLAALDAIAIEALPDGTVLILDRNEDERFSFIYRYDFGSPLGDPVSTYAMCAMIEKEQQAQFTLIAHDFAFVPEHEGPDGKVADRLYVVEAHGNQTFAFNIAQENQRLTLEPLYEYLPMRLFGGKGLVTAGPQAYYDFSDGWIPLIEQRRPRYVFEATLATPATPHFDGSEPDCVWHRLMLDACIPPTTQVQVWSRAANEERDLSFAQWQAEPHFYLRGDGSELPFAPRASARTRGVPPSASDWPWRGEAAEQPWRCRATEGNGTWELLFQHARGRYLQLQLKLSGDGRTTPRLRALRAYYPRFSYLEHYLPAVYREDEPSASFLDRFLANLEGFYTSLEDKIAVVQLLFDVRSAPRQSLEWLASWFGIALDPAWDETRQRLFIRHAMDFFAQRGTMRGLQMALRLALDECVDDTLFNDRPAKYARSSPIRIIEKYRTRRTPGVVFGDPTDVSSGPRLVSPTARWLPAQGGEELHRRFNVALQLQSFAPFSIRNPGGERAQLWQQFARNTLGFVPSTSADERKLWRDFLARRYTNINVFNTAYATRWTSFDDVPLPHDMPDGDAPLQDWLAFAQGVVSRATVNRKLWQDFLARRYRTIAALNQAYSTHWTSFEVVSLPDDLPRDGAPVLDWYQFEGVVLAMHRSAHRFTVMLPMPKSEPLSSPEHQRRLDLAQRILNLEKPAHTVFDVKFYWAMFCVGGARLGDDTLIDRGSRAPQLMPPMILGQGYLAESYLAPTHPQDVMDRQVLGRDQLSE